MCERSRFNRTRRNLLSVIEKISKQLNLIVSSFLSMHQIVDSFHLPVCKFGRAYFHKTFKGYDADYKICASKKETYYGYKVHAMATFYGYITDFVITKASIDNREALCDLFPCKFTRGRKPKNYRDIFNALLWLARTGSP